MSQSGFKELLNDPEKLTKLDEKSFSRVDIEGIKYLDIGEHSQVLFQLAKLIGVIPPTR